MATVDLSQPPQPQIIEVLGLEVILSEVKAVMLAAFPQKTAGFCCRRAGA